MKWEEERCFISSGRDQRLCLIIWDCLSVLLGFFWFCFGFWWRGRICQLKKSSHFCVTPKVLIKVKASKTYYRSQWRKRRLSEDSRTMFCFNTIHPKMLSIPFVSSSTYPLFTSTTVFKSIIYAAFIFPTYIARLPPADEIFVNFCMITWGVEDLMT